LIGLKKYVSDAETKASFRLFERGCFPPRSYTTTKLILSLLCSVCVLGLVLAEIFLLSTHDAHPSLALAARAEAIRQLLLAFTVATPTLVGITFLALWPTLYFWNRRAKRLRGRQNETAPPVVSVIADPTVWPPPPDPANHA